MLYLKFNSKHHKRGKTLFSLSEYFITVLSYNDLSWTVLWQVTWVFKELYMAPRRSIRAKLNTPAFVQLWDHILSKQRITVFCTGKTSQISFQEKPKLNVSQKPCPYKGKQWPACCTLAQSIFILRTARIFPPPTPNISAIRRNSSHPTGQTSPSSQPSQGMGCYIHL